MNDSEDRWIIHDRKSCGQFTEAIHEPNLLQMQGMEGEAVVYY